MSWMKMRVGNTCGKLGRWKEATAARVQGVERVVWDRLGLEWRKARRATRPW